MTWLLPFLLLLPVIILLLPKGTNSLNTDDYTACEDGFMPFKGKCLKQILFPDQSKKSWFHAEEGCRSLGGELISIQNAEEMKVIVDFMNDDVSMWVGLKEEVSTATTSPVYRWMNGDPVNSGYFPWASGNPHTNEQCHLYCALLYVTKDEKAEAYADCCTANHVKGYLCSTPGKRMTTCNPETAIYNNGNCSCKEGYLDMMDTSFEYKEIITRGQLCLSKRPCEKVNISTSVVLILESSTAAEPEWKNIKRFSSSISSGLPKDARLGFVSFGSNVTTKWMRRGWSSSDLAKALNRNANGGGANTPLAIKAARKMLMDENCRRKIAVLVMASAPHMTGVDEKIIMKKMRTRTEELMSDAKTDFYVVGVSCLRPQRVFSWVDQDSHFFSAKTMDELDVTTILGKICSPLTRM